MYIPTSSSTKAARADADLLDLKQLSKEASNIVDKRWLEIRNYYRAFHLDSNIFRRTVVKRSSESDLTIGIVVGVLVGVFVLAICAFLWYYGRSVKFAYSRKQLRQARRKSTGGSSKSSKSSVGGAPPPPPPPPA